MGTTVRTCGARAARLRLDQWGFALSAATAAGDDWRREHDALLVTTTADARRAGLYVRTGAQGVHDLFSDLLPPPQVADLRRRRDGLVPDGLVEGVFCEERVLHLLEQKLIRFCSSRYRLCDGRPADGPGQRDSAVLRRATLLPAEYEATARALDARHHARISDADARPVLQRLRDYPPPRGRRLGRFR